jgi:hypothetical protein
VTTDEFIRLAEDISGQQLDSLFHTWLFTAERPDLPGAALARTASARAHALHAPPAARSLIARVGVNR